jgi:hypothetical protein
MKKMFLAFLSIVFLLSGCGKDGAVGPQGPAGNANVSSTIFTVNPTEWVASGTTYRVSFTVPALTQAVLDRGSVQVYYSNATDVWLATPIVTVVSNVTQVWQPFYFVGSVRIDVGNFDGRLPANPGGPVKFKVVVIPPL